MYLCNHQNDNVFPPPSLPSELIVEILLRLPARTLVQLRCVCNLWKTLISDPNFTKKHFLNTIADPSMTNLRLAFADCSYSYPLKSLFENPSTRVIPDIFNGFESEQYYMMGSCNGFLCLYDPVENNMIMYNPSIGLKSQTSPKIELSSNWGNWGMPYNGFGYDHVNDKYKVLAVVEPDNGSESMTIIYTFGEDSWRTIQDLPYTHSQMLGKYASGTLNWIGCKEDIWASFAPESTQYEIFSFDMEKETYRDVLLPQNVGDIYYTCRPSVCVLNDSLCLCYVNKTHLVAWLMKEYGVVDSWIKLLNIPREKLVILNSIDQYSIIELLFISEKGVVLLMVSCKLFLYNLNSGVLDQLFISLENVYHPQIYREHLISPRW